jgi:hypothetical protein
MNITPQAFTVLRHLRQGSITPSQALAVYGIARLAARIHELRRAGYTVHTKMFPVGAGKHYAAYALVPTDLMAARFPFGGAR